MTTQFYQAILSLAFVVLFCACSSAQINSVVALSFDTIDKGTASGVRERQELVIKNDAQWQEIWQMHVRPYRPARELPHVNFDREMVVAVFLGERSSGGYGIEIEAIEEDPNRRRFRVLLREIKPGRGAMVIQALTQPYHIVKVEKSDLPVTFSVEP